MPSSLEPLETLLDGVPPERAAGIRAWLLPEVVCHAMRGAACEPTALALRGVTALGDPAARRAALAALAALLEGSGARGRDVLGSLDLDSEPRAREALPELLGACGPLESVEGELRAALDSPSPARRRSAMRGCARAAAGSRRGDLVAQVLAAAEHETDFTLLTEALAAIGRIAAGSLDEAAYARIAGRLASRDLRRSVDAGWNPLAGLALAVRDGPFEERAEREWLRPALASSGGSLTGARRRQAGLEAWAVLHSGRAPRGLDVIWGALDDPIRAVRFAALRAAVDTVPRGGPEDLVAELLERSRAGGMGLACAAFCLGALCEGTPHAEAQGRMVAWLAGGARAIRSAALFGLARMHRGMGDARLDDALRAELAGREGPTEWAVLALGMLHAGRPDDGIAERLRGVTRRKRPARAKGAAWAALGLLAAGEGAPAARPIALAAGGEGRGARVGALLALCGSRAALLAEYCRGFRGRLRDGSFDS